MELQAEKAARHYREVCCAQSDFVVASLTSSMSVMPEQVPFAIRAEPPPPRSFRMQQVYRELRDFSETVSQVSDVAFNETYAISAEFA